MANGDNLGTYAPSGVVGAFGRSYLLLDQQSAAVNGPFVDTSVIKAATVEIFGTASAFSIQLYGTNQDEPASNYLGQPIGNAITTYGMVSIAVPYRYVRAVMASAPTGGKVSALHYGVG
jgi:hypothetical protein